MKNMLVKKGAMVLAVSIALSSACLGTNAFANVNNRVKNKDEVKVEKAGAEAECVSDEFVYEVSVEEMYDAYVKDGILTHEEADKLEEVEESIEKLYSELDFNAYGLDKARIKAALVEIGKKEKMLRETVADIMEKVGMGSINDASAEFAMPAGSEGKVVKVGNFNK